MVRIMWLKINVVAGKVFVDLIMVLNIYLLLLYGREQKKPGLLMPFKNG